MKIENTGNFQNAIKMALENNDPEKQKELLCQTEEWLEKLKKSKEKYPQYFNNPEKTEGWWADKQELKLFRAYRQIKDFDGANSVIESMEDTEHAREYDSRQNRINTLSQEMEKFGQNNQTNKPDSKEEEKNMETIGDLFNNYYSQLESIPDQKSDEFRETKSAMMREFKTMCEVSDNYSEIISIINNEAERWEQNEIFSEEDVFWFKDGTQRMLFGALHKKAKDNLSSEQNEQIFQALNELKNNSLSPLAYSGREKAILNLYPEKKEDIKALARPLEIEGKEIRLDSIKSPDDYMDRISNIIWLIKNNEINPEEGRPTADICHKWLLETKKSPGTLISGVPEKDLSAYFRDRENELIDLLKKLGDTERAEAIDQNRWKK